LHTDARLFVNGAPAGQFTSLKPALLSSAEQDYEVMSNRAFDNSTLTGEFGLGGVLISQGGFNLADDAEVLSEMLNPADRYLLFTPGDTLHFGTRSSGAAPAPAAGSTAVEQPPDNLALAQLRARWQGQTP
jgi:hypothetical protein